MLDVTRLRVLVAVARHGSVTAAARALNYAQPSVSHHLARLESETGARLTQRSGRGIRLTEAGVLLAARAEEILGRLDAAEHELAAHVGQRDVRIRLAGFPSVLATIVPVAVAKLRASHPGTELMLTELPPPQALRMLKGGQVDVALTFRYLQDATPVCAAPAEEDGTRSRLLLSEPVHLISQASGPAPAGAGEAVTGQGGAGAGSGAASLSGYAAHRWIAGCDRCRGHLLWQCQLAGFIPRICFTTDDVLVAQALAAAGLGVALLPGLALRAARHPGIHAEPLPGARREILALTYGEPPDPPAIERLLGALVFAAGPARAGP
jgi:DNA-binding transcriptional LysR family regulator